MRYFLISYIYHTEKPSLAGTGNMWFEHKYFPSEIAIERLAMIKADKNGIENITAIIIINIFEFKSKRDYESFARQD